MTGIPQELLDLLNESPIGAIVGDDSDGAAPPAMSPAKPVEGPSPYALKMDRWGMRRGRELADAEWNTAAQLLSNEDGEAEARKAPQHAAEILADAHAACFEIKPQLADNPIDRVRAKWYETLLDNPDYHALHTQTAMNATLAEIGSKQVADQWSAYVAELTEQEQQTINEGGEEPIQSEMKRLRSCAKAVKDASGDVSEAQAAAAGLGIGEPGQQLSGAPLLKLFQQIRNDADLRRIIDLAGRYRRVAQSKQRQKKIHGRDDTVGVELSGDVARMVPAELALLTVPELELDVMRRIVERQVLSRQYRGIEPVARGPIVICVDESGSMSGEPIANAKAIALSLAWVAKFQRRWCALVGFSGGTEGTRLALPPDKWDQDALIEWLTHNYGGGTTLDVPIAELPNVYWPEFVASGLQRGKTDVVIITDAIVHCPDEMRGAFLAWKSREKAKCHGIIIGSDPGDLADLCEETHCVDCLSVDTESVTDLLGM
jgi:uncharacterized protein with von Willebrand factor type A (vWA) domain